MEKSSSSQTPRISTFILIIILGGFLGLGLYFARAKGLLPLSNYFPKVDLPKTELTQRVVHEENAVIEVVDKTSNSVVALGATKRVFNPFDPFSAPRSQNSTIGTGFVVSDKGIIVTNKHVVSDTDTKYTVVGNDGKKYEVQRIYRDPILDLAIVQIDNSDLKALEMGDSTKLKVGQTVIAIGNALGRFTNTVTTGVVSGLGRKVIAGDPFSGSVESLENLIQTDAAINPGNSGGPLLNIAGQVIGVNVATTEGAQNIGFAIPISAVKVIVDEFLEKGTVSRPFLGVRYRFIARDVALLNEVPQGAYVQEVLDGSGAKKAGVSEGDIITKIDGQSVSEEETISQTISGKRIGDSITLNLWNEGQEREVKAMLQELPNQ